MNEMAVCCMELDSVKTSLNCVFYTLLEIFEGFIYVILCHLFGDWEIHARHISDWLADLYWGWG